MSNPGFSLRHENSPLIKGVSSMGHTLTTAVRPQPLQPRIKAMVVFSHLRWDFVFQRPQHLLTRCAADHQVYYVEEPVFDGHGVESSLEIQVRGNGLEIVVPHLPLGLSEEEVHAELKNLVDQLFQQRNITDFALWYYTPMALPFTRHLQPMGVIYDCMDELSLFQGAHPLILTMEKELFQRADLVFTGGRTLYEHKRTLHHNIHPFPSSIDLPHFARARDAATREPADQQSLSHPRIGFFGVIDERMDLEILHAIASVHPEWNVVILGPVVKLDPVRLPKHPNLHYLGSKTYEDLPAYIKGWDVAILPFALNDSTRFISPTKTPEYLAAGIPVVSTPIRDVVSPYQEEGLVLIAESPHDFVKAIEKQLLVTGEAREVWLEHVDGFLASGSWDQTWSRMLDLVRRAVTRKSAGSHPALQSHTVVSSGAASSSRRAEVRTAS